MQVVHRDLFLKGGAQMGVEGGISCEMRPFVVLFHFGT
jgi:hypothetical protein